MWYGQFLRLEKGVHGVCKVSHVTDNNAIVGLVLPKNGGCICLPRTTSRLNLCARCCVIWWRWNVGGVLEGSTQTTVKCSKSIWK